MGGVTLYDRFCGCITGGALGDALGYPVEFLRFPEICEKYGKKGITSPLVSKKSGVSVFSDDTQMSLFTAEGIIWADSLDGKEGKANYTTYVFYSYQRWLYTQMKIIASREYTDVLNMNKTFPSKLMAEEQMYAKRAPGNTCIAALTQASNHGYGRFTKKINDSKECGGVVRAAPAGLYFYRDSERAFRMAAEFAAITHTHPTGYLAAGAFGALISELMGGADIEEALDIAMYILKSYDGCMETFSALELARSLDASDISPLEAVKKLGGGWTAEEALSIAVYCALCHSGSFENALCLSVNHDGDSDSTGAICGNIMGAYLGIKKIPRRWRKTLQLSELIEDISTDLYNCIAQDDEE